MKQLKELYMEALKSWVFRVVENNIFVVFPQKPNLYPKINTIPVRMLENEAASPIVLQMLQHLLMQRQIIVRCACVLSEWQKERLPCATALLRTCN